MGGELGEGALLDKLISPLLKGASLAPHKTPSALSTGPGMAGLLPNRLGSKLATLLTPHTNLQGD